MMLSTIVISPRERFSSLPASLKSLFATISPDQPVIVVEGATPLDIRSELEDIRATRPFELVSFPYPILPNVARNIGTKSATTEFVVFCDNDIEYEKDWLAELEKTARTTQADVIAPLIFIGPSEPRIIHHAGGDMFCDMVDGNLLVKDRHRLSNAKWPDVKDTLHELAPIENEGFEFHCVMIRRSLVERMGGLDERAVTRDHIDFALHAKALDAKMAFAKDAHITYRAFDPIKRLDDLHYFMYRWSDEVTGQSLDAFEASWSVLARRKKGRLKFARKQRERAVCAYHNQATETLGKLVTKKLFHKFEVGRSRAAFANALQNAPRPAPADRQPMDAAELMGFDRRAT